MRTMGNQQDSLGVGSRSTGDFSHPWGIVGKVECIFSFTLGSLLFWSFFWSNFPWLMIGRSGRQWETRQKLLMLRSKKRLLAGRTWGSFSVWGYRNAVFKPYSGPCRKGPYKYLIGRYRYEVRPSWFIRASEPLPKKGAVFYVNSLYHITYCLLSATGYWGFDQEEVVSRQT